MSHKINIQAAPAFQLDCSGLARAARIVLDAHDRACSEISVAFTDDSSVRDLNLQHRNIDAPTDVLSFPAATPPPEIDAPCPYLGDIVIAYPYTCAQARSANADLQDLLILLVVHGTLHLLGYDHDNAETRKTMWDAQEYALQLLQIDPLLVDRYGGAGLG